MSRAQLFEAKVIELEPIAVDGRTAAMILGGVCERTLYRLREQAGLPHVMLGGRVCYIPASLREWAKSNEQIIVQAVNEEATEDKSVATSVKQPQQRRKGAASNANPKRR